VLSCIISGSGSRKWSGASPKGENRMSGSAWDLKKYDGAGTEQERAGTEGRVIERERNGERAESAANNLVKPNN